MVKKNLPSGSKPGGTSVPACRRTCSSPCQRSRMEAYSKAVYSTVQHYSSCLLSHLSTSPTRYPQAANSSYCFIHPSFFCPAIASRICPVCGQLPLPTQDRNCSRVTWLCFPRGSPLVHAPGCLSPLASVLPPSTGPLAALLTTNFSPSDSCVYRRCGTGPMSKVGAGRHRQGCPGPPSSKPRNQARGYIIRATNLGCLPRGRFGSQDTVSQGAGTVGICGWE